MTDHITLPRSVVEQAIEALSFYADGKHVVTLSGRIDWAQERKRLEAAGFSLSHENYNGSEEFVENGIQAYGALDALRAALAAQQAEPVATYMGHRLTPDGTKEFWGLANTPLAKGTKLYTAPQPAQPVAVPEEMSPEFTDTARSALLWVLWHHQGGSSKVGQPIRFALGMGQHEHLNAHQVTEAKRWGELNAAPTPPAATVPVLEPLTLDEVFDQVEILPASNSAPIDAFLKGIRFAEAAHAAKLAKLNGITPPAEGSAS